MPNTQKTPRSPIVTGLDRLAQKPPSALKGARLGLLCNPASVTRGYESAPEALAKAYPKGLSCLFSPQHGLFAEKQDNMVESEHTKDPRLGIPVHSLYSDTRKPAPEMLAGLDAILVDLWDVGCRVYTFFSTALACMKAAADQGVSIWILDRPNPIGRGEEGPILPTGLMSFVGPHAMPLRHGLTMGELCRLAADELGLDVDLHVLPCLGWQGGHIMPGQVTWVMPSPNLPGLASARVYPGQVMIEGLSLSEGRGTTRPFELFGCPGLDPFKVLPEVGKKALAGAVLRPLFFEPTFHKHAGRACGGFQIHLTDPAVYRPLRASLAVIAAINRSHPGLVSLKEPPYEYEHDRRPLDLILGDAAAVDRLMAGEDAAALEEAWQPGLEKWRERCAPHLIYPV